MQLIICLFNEINNLVKVYKKYPVHQIRFSVPHKICCVPNYFLCSTQDTMCIKLLFVFHTRYHVCKISFSVPHKISCVSNYFYIPHKISCVPNYIFCSTQDNMCIKFTFYVPHKISCVLNYILCSTFCVPNCLLIGTASLISCNCCPVLQTWAHGCSKHTFLGNTLTFAKKIRQIDKTVTDNGNYCL